MPKPYPAHKPRTVLYAVTMAVMAIIGLAAACLSAAKIVMIPLDVNKPGFGAELDVIDSGSSDLPVTSTEDTAP